MRNRKGCGGLGVTRAATSEADHSPNPGPSSIHTLSPSLSLSLSLSLSQACAYPYPYSTPTPTPTPNLREESVATTSAYGGVVGGGSSQLHSASGLGLGLGVGVGLGLGCLETPYMQHARTHACDKHMRTSPRRCRCCARARRRPLSLSLPRRQARPRRAAGRNPCRRGRCPQRTHRRMRASASPQP